MLRGLMVACTDAEYRAAVFMSFAGIAVVVGSCALVGHLATRGDRLERANRDLWAECDRLRQRLESYERITDITTRTRSAIRRIAR